MKFGGKNFKLNESGIDLQEIKSNSSKSLSE